MVPLKQVRIVKENKNLRVVKQVPCVLQARVQNVLNGIRSMAGDVCMSTLHYHNATLVMASCGSKGSAINIAQMVACVGQQSVGGKRCADGFKGRTTPHFPKCAALSFPFLPAFSLYPFCLHFLFCGCLSVRTRFKGCTTPRFPSALPCVSPFCRRFLFYQEGAFSESAL